MITTSSDRLIVPVSSSDAAWTIDAQVSKTALLNPTRHKVPDGRNARRPIDNAELWKLYHGDGLIETLRLTLDTFHLFQWFPLSPGLYHTSEAADERDLVSNLRKEYMPDGRAYLQPYAKAHMVRGGIGAVRLKPIRFDRKDWFFMTASSNGICHEGFPVLIARDDFRRIAPRLLSEGAVPVTLSGELRSVPRTIVRDIFGQRRDLDIPYLYVDTLTALLQPRPEVRKYLVSAVVLFKGTVAGAQGTYLSYATFDASRRDGPARAARWLREAYIRDLYQGTVFTDFDEAYPRFPEAIFGLSVILSGRIDEQRVAALVHAGTLPSYRPGQIVYINGDVNGDLISIGDIKRSRNIAIGRGASAS